MPQSIVKSDLSNFIFYNAITYPLNVRIEVEVEEEDESKVTDSQEILEVGKKGGKVKEIEAVLFVPATPDSELRKLIQKAEDQAAKLINTPTIRAVERAGTN